jgi:hypothetical protein
MQFNQEIHSFQVNIAVGGGPDTPVIVDTGSRGLLLPQTDVDLNALGTPTAQGVATYGTPENGHTAYYDVYRTSVDFGSGMITTPIDVGVVYKWVTTTTPSGGSTPTTTPQPLSSFPSVLGIGPYGSEPDPSVTALPPHFLPGALGGGVLINAYNAPTGGGGVVQFGPNPLSEVTSITAVPGVINGLPAVTSPLTVIFTSPSGVAYHNVEPMPSAIDSGGIYGFIPVTVNGVTTIPGLKGGDHLPAGFTISIMSGQTQLESYTVPQTEPLQSPLYSTDNHFNSGYLPFLYQPIYVSYANVETMTMTFDRPFS